MVFHSAGVVVISTLTREKAVFAYFYGPSEKNKVNKPHQQFDIQSSFYMLIILFMISLKTHLSICLGPCKTAKLLLLEGSRPVFMPQCF